MKRLITIMFTMMLTITLFASCQADSIKQPEKKTTDSPQKQLSGRYELYPTKNMWTFIKLDTKTGATWQVQYSIKGSSYRFETPLDTSSAVTSGLEYNGRFALYPTENIFNFVMLDKLNGDVYQIQWSSDAENRCRIKIHNFEDQ